jgi:Zn finger protein HypA/HybF involved in hydrogenase expression
MAKGETGKLKCKKCAKHPFMVATSDPFMGTIFGKGGKNTKKLSQFVQCPNCKARGIERLED